MRKLNTFLLLLRTIVAVSISTKNSGFPVYVYNFAKLMLFKGKITENRLFIIIEKRTNKKIIKISQFKKTLSSVYTCTRSNLHGFFYNDGGVVTTAT